MPKEATVFAASIAAFFATKWLRGRLYAQNLLSPRESPRAAAAPATPPAPSPIAPREPESPGPNQVFGTTLQGPDALFKTAELMGSTTGVCVAVVDVAAQRTREALAERFAKVAQRVVERNQTWALLRQGVRAEIAESKREYLVMAVKVTFHGFQHLSGDQAVHTYCVDGYASCAEVHQLLCRLAPLANETLLLNTALAIDGRLLHVERRAEPFWKELVAALVAVRGKEAARTGALELEVWNLHQAFRLIVEAPANEGVVTIGDLAPADAVDMADLVYTRSEDLSAETVRIQDQFFVGITHRKTARELVRLGSMSAATPIGIVFRGRVIPLPNLSKLEFAMRECHDPLVCWYGAMSPDAVLRGAANVVAATGGMLHVGPVTVTVLPHMLREDCTLEIIYNEHAMLDAMPWARGTPVADIPAIYPPVSVRFYVGPYHKFEQVPFVAGGYAVIQLDISSGWSLRGLAPVVIHGLTSKYQGDSSSLVVGESSPTTLAFHVSSSDTWYIQSGVKCHTLTLDSTCMNAAYNRDYDDPELEHTPQVRGPGTDAFPYYYPYRFRRYGLQVHDTAAPSTWLAKNHNNNEGCVVFMGVSVACLDAIIHAVCGRCCQNEAASADSATAPQSSDTSGAVLFKQGRLSSVVVTPSAKYAATSRFVKPVLLKNGLLAQVVVMLRADPRKRVGYPGFGATDTVGWTDYARKHGFSETLDDNYSNFELEWTYADPAALHVYGILLRVVQSTWIDHVFQAMLERDYASRWVIIMIGSFQPMSRQDKDFALLARSAWEKHTSGRVIQCVLVPRHDAGVKQVIEPSASRLAGARAYIQSDPELWNWTSVDAEDLNATYDTDSKHSDMSVIHRVATRWVEAVPGVRIAYVCGANHVSAKDTNAFPRICDLAIPPAHETLDTSSFTSANRSKAPVKLL